MPVSLLSLCLPVSLVLIPLTCVAPACSLVPGVYVFGVSVQSPSGPASLSCSVSVIIVCSCVLCPALPHLDRTLLDYSVGLLCSFWIVYLGFFGLSHSTNSNTSNQLWSVENTVSNLTESMSAVQQLTKDAAKDVHRLKFAVESNKDQLTSVSEELKQLSALDSIRRSVAMLKCSLERIIHNSSVVDGCCPLEWDIFGTSCYFFSQTTLSWDKARDWCSAHGSHLVILNSDDEWAFVTRHTLGIFYWVGLTDERTGRWEWVNQTPYIMNRRRWAPGQPDNWNGHGLGPGGEDCAHLFPDGRLNDQHCSIKMRFVCQKHSLRV
ncbi:asialoglycoprotein receptor 1-like isoform X1 [Micropterus salmoides]|uniref:asialoglycoprotein receptor 1-like isoform X1 n=1 Tax=Micropterus salmoides TaxID=27706 RepID=UPI0018ECE320|nr:asialoglycoprotein receptor 1-like isoform X1 [Micropterus salmoides]